MNIPPTALFTSRSFKVIRWTSAVNLSYDRIDILHMWGTTVGDIWKNCGHFSASSFRNSLIFWISWTSGCNRFPCYFFLMFAPWFRLRKFPWFLTFICCGKFLRHFSHQTAKVCIFQPSLRTRRCVGFWISSCPRVRFHCRCFEYPWAFSTQSGGSRMRSMSRQFDVSFIAVGFEFPTILSSSFCSCILFAVVLGQLVKLKFWSQQVELKWMMLNKWRKMFHSSRVWNYLWSIWLRVDVWCRCTRFESLDPD